MTAPSKAPRNINVCLASLLLRVSMCTFTPATNTGSSAKAALARGGSPPRVYTVRGDESEAQAQVNSTKAALELRTCPRQEQNVMPGGVLTAAIPVRTGVIQVRFECDSSVIRVPLQRFMAHGRAYELMFGVIQPSPLCPFIILKGKSEHKRAQKGRLGTLCRRLGTLSREASRILPRLAPSLLEFYRALRRDTSRFVPRLLDFYHDCCCLGGPNSPGQISSTTRPSL